MRDLDLVLNSKMLHYKFNKQVYYWNQKLKIELPKQELEHFHFQKKYYWLCSFTQISPTVAETYKTSIQVEHISPPEND